MHILGAASAYPGTAITDEFLSSLSIDGAAPSRTISSGISNRWSVLPEEYLRSTRNADKMAGAKAAASSPTELGHRAAQEALRRAGIEPEAVGLILGDVSNPLETCPSEAQRVGGRLGLKVEAFDIVVADAGLPGYLKTLSSFKAERMPEYVLCVSSSTPTRAVDYASGEARYLLGDVAAAAVLSRAHEGKVVCRAAHFERFRGSGLQVHLGLYGTLELDSPTAMEPLLDEAVRLGKLALDAARGIDGRIRLVPPPIGGAFADRLAERLALRPEQVVRHLASIGCGLGVAGWAALADHWDTLETGDVVVSLSTGVGLHQGFAVLERR